MSVLRGVSYCAIACLFAVVLGCSSNPLTSLSKEEQKDEVRKAWGTVLRGMLSVQLTNESYTPMDDYHTWINDSNSAGTVTVSGDIRSTSLYDDVTMTYTFRGFDDGVTDYAVVEGGILILETQYRDTSDIHFSGKVTLSGGIIETIEVSESSTVVGNPGVTMSDSGTLTVNGSTIYDLPL